MNNCRITLLGSQDKELQEWLTGHPQKHERGAIILFRRLSRPVEGIPQSGRFIAIEIIKMTNDWIIDSSEIHLKINMRKFPDIYFRCEIEGLELGFAHSHPSGFLEFSQQDNINEQNILHGISSCNGQTSFLVSLILSDSKWLARVRQGLNKTNIIPVRHISVLSDKVEIHGIKNNEGSIDTLKRQEAAFGKPFNNKLQSLRVAIIGLGGTGSATATLLARLGVGELILIDGDNLEKSNMNRVRGYNDNHIGKSKASSLNSFINSLNLQNSTTFITAFINESPEAIDAISSADIVFGCTDDVIGRDILNQSIYYYAQVLIDMGLTGFIVKGDDEIPYLKDHRGRISCILPEHGACLRCQNVVNDEKLEFEQALKNNPELINIEPETLEREYYLKGGGVQAPGIGPFTSSTADYAVASFMDLINPYRKLPSDLRQDNIWVDFIHLYIHSNEPIHNPDCIYCKSKKILLKSEKNYRLDMPILGKIPTNE